MKITRVDAIPMKTGRMLVQVSTDEGISGIGECGGGNRAGMLKAFIEDILQPIIVGKDPRRINQIWEEMFFTTHRLGPMGMQTTGARSPLPSQASCSEWCSRGPVAPRCSWSLCAAWPAPARACPEHAQAMRALAHAAVCTRRHARTL